MQNLAGLRILQAHDDNPTRVLISYLDRRAFEIAQFEGDPLKAIDYYVVSRELREAFTVSVIDEIVSKAAVELGYEAGKHLQK